MFQRLLAVLLTACLGWSADLPVREVILYKHGVAYFERGGDVKAGEAARLDFKADEMNDVLKSLTINDRSGTKVSGVRYDASEPLEKRLNEFAFKISPEAPLSNLLDQMRGARIELTVGSQSVAGTIVGARLVKAEDKNPEHDSLVLMTDSGDIRTLDLSSATSMRLSDPKLQTQVKDYLSVLSGSRSQDRRSVTIESTSAGARQISASYMTPAAVWKSSYRLIFGQQAEPLLEGWAIVDNTSGDDWNNVKLSVVSGRPISFITELYAPKYVNRPHADVTEEASAAPVVFSGAVAGFAAGKAAPAPPSQAQFRRSTAAGENLVHSETGPSTVAVAASGQDTGELFEYDFTSPVTVKRGESSMLPFLQQRINARKLLIYQESFGLHPMNAAEISNSTGKTLDGGPITVYDANTYAGEALVETVKANDKRLISYGVDLATRVSTTWNTSRQVTREVHVRRGTLTTKSAIEETRTFTIKNVDAKEKTLIIEHPQRPGYALLSEKAKELTPTAYRFEVKLGPSEATTFPVREERVFDQTLGVESLTPALISTWLQNKALSDAGRKTLEDIQREKQDIATNDEALGGVRTDQQNLTQDQTRLRENIEALRSVAGQQDQVQQYARQLATNETQIASLRDKENDLRKKKTTLEAQLNALIERADF
jgi:hypothetical protein